MAKLLPKDRLSVHKKVSITFEFEGEYYKEGFQVNLFVEGMVIIKLKSVKKITDTHKKQLLT